MNKLLVLGAAVAAGAMVQAEPVTLKTGDAAGESSFTSGENWSDGAVPSSDKEYLVALGAEGLLRAPVIFNEFRNEAWSGGSLTLGSDDAEGWLELPISSTNRTPKITEGTSKWYPYVSIADLTIKSGGLVFPYPRNYGLVGTTLTVDSKSPVTVRFGGNDPDGVSDDSHLYFGTKLVGDTDQTIVFSNAVSSKEACVFLSGDNSGFKGRMVFDRVKLTDTRCETLNAGRYGGDPGFFMPDALYFPNGFYFGRVSESGTDQNTQTDFPSVKNRGITFRNGGKVGMYTNNRVYVPVPIVGDTLTIDSGISKNAFNYHNGRVQIDAQVTVEEINFTGVVGGFPTLIFGEAIEDESSCVVKLKESSAVGAMGTCKIRIEAVSDGGYVESRANAEATGVGHVIIDPRSDLSKLTKLRVTTSGAPAYGYAKDWWPVCTVPKAVFASKDNIEVLSVSTGTAVTHPWKVEEEGENFVVYVGKAADAYKYVVPAGTPGNTPTAPYNSWETAANDIQTAVNAATGGSSSGSRGETVLVAPGTYDISKTLLVEKRIQLRSCNPETGLVDREHTILDGGYPARTNRIMKLKTAQVAGFTFRNGATTAIDYYSTYARGGGAMVVNGDSEWRVRNCVFRNNHAIKTQGGAMSCFTYDAINHVVDCVFEENSTLESGSGGAYGAETTNGSEAGIGFVNCVFRNNVAVDNGGAVYSSRPSYFTDCTFKNNCNGELTSDTRTFTGGKEVYASGARYVRCVFENDCPDQTYGGLVSGASFRFEDTVFRNCKNIQCLFVQNGWNLSGQPDVCERLVVTNNTLSSSLCYLVEVADNVSFKHCLIANNAMRKLFSIHTYGVDIAQCTVANNTFSDSENYTYNLRPSTIVNSVFWGNTYAGYKAERLVKASASNSVLQTSETGGTCENVWVRAPGFVGNGDVHLRDGAFAREKGLMLDFCKGDFCVDLDGLPRRVDRDGHAYTAAALPDLGCYEAQGKTPGLLLLLR